MINNNTNNNNDNLIKMESRKNINREKLNLEKVN